MTDTKITPASEWLQTLDAREWAREFIRIYETTDNTIEEGWMTSWFANAIMRGFDEGGRQAEADRARSADLENQRAVLQARIAELEGRSKIIDAEVQRDTDVAIRHGNEIADLKLTIAKQAKRVIYLEALLVVAANGHDAGWDVPDVDPEDCTQCVYEGMREALAEGRRIIAREAGVPE